MRLLTRAAVTALCAVSVGLAVAPVAEASAQVTGQGCRYYFTSWGQGPNGETDGFRDYPEGATDPEGRVCQNGWWVDPNEGQDGGW